MSVEQAYGLWSRYNTALVELHQRYTFQLVQFSLADVSVYCSAVTRVAASLGLRPDSAGLSEFVDHQLDHHLTPNDEIPDQCRDVYEYLLRNRS
jgi:hypothetical protein